MVYVDIREISEFGGIWEYSEIYFEFFGFLSDSFGLSGNWDFFDYFDYRYERDDDDNWVQQEFREIKGFKFKNEQDALLFRLRFAKFPPPNWDW